MMNECHLLGIPREVFNSFELCDLGSCGLARLHAELVTAANADALKICSICRCAALLLANNAESSRS